MHVAAPVPLHTTVPVQQESEAFFSSVLTVKPTESISTSPPLRISLFLSDLSGGGAERIFLNVASWLKNQKGIEVTLVCLKKQGVLVADLPPGLKVVELNTAGVMGGVRPLGRYLKQSNIDLLLSTQFHNNLAAALACRLYAPSCRLILRESNTPSLHNGPSLAARTGRLQRWLAFGLSGWLYRRAHGYIAVSEGVREDMTSYYRVEPARIRVIPNPVTGPDLERQIEEEPAWTPPGDWADSDLIVTAGRVTPQKGHDQLIEAFARARNQASKMEQPRDLKLVVMGHYEEDDFWFKKLKKLTRLRGVEEDVAWVGYQLNPFPLMRMASLFVLSSRREGLPGALIQALACGTPVVSIDCPNGPAEILADGHWGELVAPKDTRALGEAICRSLNRPYDPDTLKKRASYWSTPLRAAEYLAYMREVAGS